MIKTRAFQEFEENLGFATRLVEGGRSFENLEVGAFDITDLYRSAWVQAVSALDHWVHEEIYSRAVALVRNPSVSKPKKLAEFEIPVALFEEIHHRSAPLAEAFADQLRRALGWRSFQHPDRIKEGFALVSDIPLWSSVAKHLSTQHPSGQHTTAAEARERLRAITERRNRIAHSADRDSTTSSGRALLAAETVQETIDWLRSLAVAILESLDGTHSQLGGNPYLLVLADGVAVRWVLENSQFAFTAASQTKSKRLEVGDTLFLVTTRRCWGNPDQDTTRIIGISTVTGPVNDYREPVRISQREFVCGCPLTIQTLAPIGSGADLSALAPQLETFGGSTNYGIRLRNTLVRLSSDDALAIRDRLAQSAGDPADYIPEYVRWTA